MVEFDEGLVVKVMLGFLVLVILGMFLFSAIFRINTGQGAIVTHIGGNKDATTRVGWHFVIPFFESYKKYPVVNDYIYFPTGLTKTGGGGEGIGVSGVEINAKDDTVVDVSAITFFDRTDLFQWGVKNVDPDVQFDRAVSGIIRDIIQTSSASDILHDRPKVEQEIYTKLKSSNIETQYGVAITKFQIQHSSYIDEVVKVNAHKQALGLEAEGRLDASRKDAEAIKIKADAENYKANLLSKYSEASLSYMAQIELFNTLRSRATDVVWVDPSGMSTDPVFNPQVKTG